MKGKERLHFFLVAYILKYIFFAFPFMQWTKIWWYFCMKSIPFVSRCRIFNESLPCHDLSALYYFSCWCHVLLCFILYPWFEVQPFYLAEIVVIICNEHLDAFFFWGGERRWELCEYRHISRNPRFYSCYISIWFAMTLYDVLHICMQCRHSDNDSLKGWKK